MGEDGRVEDKSTLVKDDRRILEKGGGEVVGRNAIGRRRRLPNVRIGNGSDDDGERRGEGRRWSGGGG